MRARLTLGFLLDDYADVNFVWHMHAGWLGTARKTVSVLLGHDTVEHAA